MGGAAGHLFWRDPAVGLLGAYGYYARADLPDSDFWGAGAEGALYLRRVTLEGIAGAEWGPERGGAGGGLDSDPRFFEVAWLAYYPADNLKLSIGQSYGFETFSALFDAEWGAWSSGKTMTSLFALGKVSEDGDGAVLGGLRIYLGNEAKSLIRRNRVRTIQPPPALSLGPSITVSAAPSGQAGYRRRRSRRHTGLAGLNSLERGAAVTP